MWPFKRKKSEAEIALEQMPRAIEAACQKWLYMHSFIKYKDGTPLEAQYRGFLIPFEQFIRSWDAFKDAPDPVIGLIVINGIIKSGTHTREQVEQGLGIELAE